MSDHSPYLSALDKPGRLALERRLWTQQSGKCFICDEAIDLVLHDGLLDVDHIQPLAELGPDDENNFALTHAACNRSKGASDLRVARRMSEFQRLQERAQAAGDRGATLGHVLQKYGGAKASLRVKREETALHFVLSDVGEKGITSVPLFKDGLSGMEYAFAMLPLEYLHHDDRINPRSIGSNIRGLIEEFMRKRPQLHVSLAWWHDDGSGAGQVKVFDGQHKAAAQILLGQRRLPVRIFFNPDINVLLQANTNAGDKLRQVAFDAAVLRHLGSTLFAERVRQYQEIKHLPLDDYSFSEKDLVTFFKGEHREMLRYIIDSVRDAVTHNKDNGMMEFVEWAGKGATRPMSYSSLEKTFFSDLLYMSALDSPIGAGMETGDNPRLLERTQLIRLMSIYARAFFVGQWDPDIGGTKLEDRLQKGKPIPEGHLRAWRIGREEVVRVTVQWIRTVIEHYYAFAGKVIDKERLLQRQHPEEVWMHIQSFLTHLGTLPCWIDKNLSTTVFGAKQRPDFWRQVFNTGVAPTGVRVLAKPLELTSMIRAHAQEQG